MDAELDRLLELYANPPGSAARVTGPHRFGEVAEEVSALRQIVYAAESPHLLLPPVLELERDLRLDQRTAHFCVWAPDGTLAGAMRVSPAAIELPALSLRCAELAQAYAAYGEITRVIIARRHRGRDLPARLFAAMVQWMLAEERATGIVGVCRERVLPFYEAFGLVPLNDDPLTVAGRPTDDYRVIAATFEKMIELGMYRLLSVAPAKTPTA